MKLQNGDSVRWSENIIIADADYIDRVAFDLTVNFERMLERRIPQADIARWLDCIALDGGVREGENEVQVVLLHDNDTKSLANFAPSDFETDLDAKAFKDSLGEFTLTSLPVEPIISKEQMIIDIVGAACVQKEVKRVMVIPNVDDGVVWERLRSALRHVEDETKRITLFAMQPMPGGKFQQEILGYSLMSALGIKASELK